MKKLILGLIVASLSVAPAMAAKKRAAKGKSKGAAAGAWMKKPGLYAKFETSKGGFVCSLFEKEAPETVAAIVGLAIGEREYKDVADGEMKKGRFYDGLTFHRVVPDYIIQGGDPKGDSTGNAGFQFDDEINGLKFDKPGRLAMANSGANTNGSQFFITSIAAPDLNDKQDADGNITVHYTIFGQVVDGQKVVDDISHSKAEAEKPVEPVLLKKLEVLRVDRKGRAAPVTTAPVPPSAKAEAAEKTEAAGVKEGAEGDTTVAAADDEKPAVKPAKAKKSKGKKKKKKKV